MIRRISLTLIALATLGQFAAAEPAQSSHVDKASAFRNKLPVAEGVNVICSQSEIDEILQLRRNMMRGNILSSMAPAPLSLSDCPTRSNRLLTNVAYRKAAQQPINREKSSNSDLREVSPLQGLYIPGRENVAEAPVVEDEFAERRRIREEVRWLYITHMPKPEIEKLEAIFNSYRGSKARTSSGVWKLTVAYSFLPTLYNDWLTAPEKSIKIDHATLDEWSAKFPSSPTPYIIRAEIEITQALALLGDRIARASYPGGIDAIKAKLESARKYLEQHKEIASNCPQWHVLMMRILRAQSAPVEDVVNVAISGAEKHRGFQDIYFEAVRAIGRLSAKPLDDIEALANTSVKLTEADQSDELYARVYWIALRESNNLYRLEQFKWNWTKMVSAMNTVIAKYPVQWNIQNFAQFSCMMQDKATLKEFMARIIGRPDLQVWGQSEYFEACRSWAVSETDGAASDGNSRKATFGQH